MNEYASHCTYWLLEIILTNIGDAPWNVAFIIVRYFLASDCFQRWNRKFSIERLQLDLFLLPSLATNPQQLNSTRPSAAYLSTFIYLYEGDERAAGTRFVEQKNNTGWLPSSLTKAEKTGIIHIRFLLAVCETSNFPLKLKAKNIYYRGIIQGNEKISSLVDECANNELYIIVMCKLCETNSLVIVDISTGRWQPRGTNPPRTKAMLVTPSLFCKELNN